MKKVLFLIALFTLIGGINSVKATNDVVDMNVNVNVDDETRNYQLYVPANVDKDCPLVISLHGANGASTNYSPFTREVASAKGCIVAYPQGKQTYFPIGFGGYATGWTATGKNNFDVRFLKAVIEDVASKYQIDRKRIYCCGFSNGGMMTYAMANVCSDEIAAFASISGYPINEFHLRHTSSRPVPFMHIHGKADGFVLYEKMPTIVDEMVARLGANPVPTKTTVSGMYTKSVYEAGQGGFPYVYYEVDGMGHEAYTTKTEDGNSALTMWNFFKDYTLDSPSDETLKWAPRIETAGFEPTAHGFTMNDGTTLLSFGGAQYTEANKNVYSSLQFESGKYKLCFTSTGASGKTIGVRIVKLTSPYKVVLNTTVNVGEDAELPFEVSDGWGEYRLTMTRPEVGDNISVTDISVIKTGEADVPAEGEEGTKTPLLLLKNGVINTTDFDITPIETSTLTTDNLYAATFTSKAGTSNVFQYKNLDVRAYDKAVIKYSILDANEWRVNTPVNHYALPSGTDKTYEIDLSGVDTYSDFTVFSSYQNHTVGSSITISEVYLFKSSDPLAPQKSALQDAINKGNAQNSFAKTTESWNALQTAITTGASVLANSEDADELTAATTAINNAINGFVLQDGYTNLTEDMFKHWNDNDVPTIAENTGCAYVLNKSTGQPYGDGSVGYLNFADVSDFSKLIVTGGNGAPRIMMNRQVPIEPGQEGYDANGGAYVQFTDVFVDGKKEVDLTAYDYAHINAIKGANWANVTVTGIYLYREIAVGSTGYATFGSLYKSAKPNGVTAYAAKYVDGQVNLNPVTNVPAGKGVVIMGDEGSHAPTFDVAADDIDSDLEVSNGTVVGDGSTIYVLNKVADKVGFYLLKAGNPIEAGKAYLKINGAGSARAFIGISGMDVTGISAVKQSADIKDDVIYNLNGQRVSNPRKGLFIKNGVKFLAD